MNRTLIKETPSLVGTTVTLAGFVDSTRKMGKITFVDLRDVSGKLQCVGYQMMDDLTLESVIQVTGEVKKRPEKMINQDMITGTVELDVREYKILSKAEALPIQVNEAGMNEAESDKRLDYRWIDLRKEKNQLIFKVWSELERAMREYWISNGYIEIHSPKIIAAASESGAEVFEVKYFDRKAYLAQSPQFYKQMAMAAGLERVFEIAPAFRAENSNTIRHATEFTSIDLEISYINSYEDVMEEEERLLVAGFQGVSEKYGEEIKKVFGIDFKVPLTPFPRLSLTEIKKVLKEKGIASEKDGDLSSEEEKALGEYVVEKFGHDFVFVTGYPKHTRAFYHMREDDNLTACGFDLVYKGLEITTGAQREHRYEKLLKQALEKGLTQESIQFYLDFFRYGVPPHGGLAIGPSRLVMKMLNLHSIRESSFLFRNPRRLNP